MRAGLAGRAGPLPPDPLEGERRTSAVPDQPLDARPVIVLDAHRGVYAEPSGSLPVEHAVGVRFVEQALGAEVAKHPVLYDMLEFEPVGRSELAALMEMGLSVLGGRKHSVEHDDVIVKVCVERGAESMEEGDGPESGVPGRPRARMAQCGPDGANEDPEDTSGHTARVTGGTYTPGFAGKRNQSFVTTTLTLRPGEAVGWYATLQVRSEILLHPGGGAETHGVGLYGLGEESFEMMLDHRVERCGRWPARPVDRPGGDPVGQRSLVLSISVSGATMCPGCHGRP